MNKREARLQLERFFGIGDKSEFIQVAKDLQPPMAAEILWDMRAQSAKLAGAAAELKQLQERIQTMKGKPGFRTRCLEILDGRRVLLQLGSVREEAAIAPHLDLNNLGPGTEVLVQGNQSNRMVVDTRESYRVDGNIGTVSQVLDGNRAVMDEAGRKIVLCVAEGLELSAGSSVRYDPTARVILEVLEEGRTPEFDLVDTPLYSFDDIGGLEDEKRKLRERIIYPLIYRDRFQKYGLGAIRGGLLHGPPGCGKTMLASAIFNEMTGIRRKDNPDLEACDARKGFFVINGPEPLSMWIGNTEASIRDLFRKAREFAEKSGFPSLIFWDELESVAGTRRDSPTYKPEKTVVPTLLAELQGLEDGGDVIFLGATNRPDLIDPALLRAERLGDAIVEIPRPDRGDALSILTKSLSQELPAALKVLAEQGLAEVIVSHVYDSKSALTMIRQYDGARAPLMRCELASGALFVQVVKELKLVACMAEILGRNESVSMPDGPRIIDDILEAQASARSSLERIGPLAAVS